LHCRRAVLVTYGSVAPLDSPSTPEIATSDCGKRCFWAMPVNKLQRRAHYGIFHTSLRYSDPAEHRRDRKMPARGTKSDCDAVSTKADQSPQKPPQSCRAPTLIRKPAS